MLAAPATWRPSLVAPLAPAPFSRPAPRLWQEVDVNAKFGVRRFRGLRRVEAQSTAQTGTAELILVEAWRILPDGRFRGRLSCGTTVEFKGELVGPEDPGVVVGPGGVRYLLGQAGAPEPDEPAKASESNMWQAAAAAAVAAVAAFLVLPGLQSTASLMTSSGIPVTRTNITIVETTKVMPDGSKVKVKDQTTRRERSAPGKAPVVTERTIRTEKACSEGTYRRRNEATAKVQACQVGLT
ncbi:unnamed protein product [Effrenium voratum]|nr:unnamed protein product [Effrenium voratum]